MEVLSSLVGSWHGICRTWLTPGELADESPIDGEIEPILGGKAVRHQYESTIFDKPRRGEETIAFNQAEEIFELAWVDTFHTYGVFFQHGSGTERGFAVKGQYRTAPGEVAWGWRTEFELADDDHLTITSFNITPDGEEAKAVEVVYERGPRP